MWKQLWAKKKLKDLLDEMAGDHRLKRVLGPVTLTALACLRGDRSGHSAATGAACIASPVRR